MRREGDKEGGREGGDKENERRETREEYEVGTRREAKKEEGTRSKGHKERLRGRCKERDEGERQGGGR